MGEADMFLALNACSNVTDWLQAIGTVGAVIIALFFYFWDRIRDWYNKPRLKISLRFNPPDCNCLITNLKVKNSDGKIINPEAFWFRLTILNDGRSSAKDLEAIVSDMQKKIGKSWEIYPSFLQSSLKWTHLDNRQYLPILLPHTEKNLELGHMINPLYRYAFRDEKNFSLDNISDTQGLFHFETFMQPSNGYNNILPGEYRFKISVGAANCPPVSSSIYLFFTGEWNRDEKLMLQKEINITIE